MVDSVSEQEASKVKGQKSEIKKCRNSNRQQRREACHFDGDTYKVQRYMQSSI
jgi:hypothetical protein